MYRRSWSSEKGSMMTRADSPRPKRWLLVSRSRLLSMMGKKSWLASCAIGVDAVGVSGV
jgi:hypothetical protein